MCPEITNLERICSHSTVQDILSNARERNLVQKLLKNKFTDKSGLKFTPKTPPTMVSCVRLGLHIVGRFLDCHYENPIKKLFNKPETFADGYLFSMPDGMFWLSPLHMVHVDYDDFSNYER